MQPELGLTIIPDKTEGGECQLNIIISMKADVVGTLGGNSNKYPQHMFLWRNKKTTITFWLK